MSRSPRTGLARALSKRGYCSRTQAARLVADGRVTLDGRLARDPETPTCITSRIQVDGVDVQMAQPVYLALNKPRGLVTTTQDEHARDTVYRCLDGAGLPWLSPVGRLDKASEGLLLLTNDTGFASTLTEPSHGVVKTYHVQVSPPPSEETLARMRQGVTVGDERLGVVSVELLRTGERNAWLGICLDEGRNRHLRRLCQALDLAVLRLVRVAIGPLLLGTLAKGSWRHLAPAEVAALSDASKGITP